MKKIYWSKKTKEIIESFGFRPRLLLHSCCAPCGSYVITYLMEFCDIAVIYYNPNIHPAEEYQRRYSEQKRLLKILKIKYIDSQYCPGVFDEEIKGFETYPEGGERCLKCFNLRLSATAEAAKREGFDLFGTTLTVSPHKNADVINALLMEIGEKTGISPLLADFKKNGGYAKSIELSGKYGLYRQNYCGCRFSY
ncbi:MAG: epoxyqueuosine reductase QueH [Eubacterium sp.]|jgi:predicted adenine nucleotide alpha hydrolase (AANH) superfamily ATPase|nr:epoxyqueuosine reductase QueH [Eubacterium sp.]